MQWIKGKMGYGDDGSASRREKQQAGSSHAGTAFPTAPAGSFKNPETAQTAVQSYDAQSNPYVDHGRRASKAGGSDEEGEAAEEEEVLTGEQVLVTIPGAIVHLIDEEESVHLATGDFSLTRLVQEKTKVVVIGSVGKDLKWPVFQEQQTVKLDETHYYFSIKVPKDMDEEDNRSAGAQRKRNSLEVDDTTEMDTLNYGLTFPAGSAGDDHAAKIRELDEYLERYSEFSAPVIVQGDAKDAETAEALGRGPQDPSFQGKIVPAETVAGNGEVANTEEGNAAFWTTVAPNVDDYNSRLARGIATGAGHVIRGIFWCSDSTVRNLDSGHIYMKSKFKPNDKKSKINPVTMGSVRRARQLSGMTDKVARGVLGGILYTTGLVSSAVINSAPGKKFFKLLPGEVSLVSLDAFGRVFDAVEKAGQDVMSRSSFVTQDFVNHRYGESAAQLTKESFQTAGHAASTVWTLTKIRKALNPSRMKVSKTGIAKAVAKSAVGAGKKA